MLKSEEQSKKEYRTLQFRINKEHELFEYCDQMCFNSKNLYNVGMFHLRQLMTGLKKDKALVQNLEKEVIEKVKHYLPSLNEIKEREHEKKNKKRLQQGKKELLFKPYVMPTEQHWFLDKNILDGILKLEENADYRSLPAQSSQGILTQLYEDWNSFFALNKLYHENPTTLTGKPKIPKYAKKDGRKITIISNQDAVIYHKETTYLKLPKTKLKYELSKAPIPKEGKLKQVRIVPSSNFYVLELIFQIPEIEVLTIKETSKNIIAIDLGVNNFATIVSNVGKEPIIIKGGVLKAKNQWYNKQRSRYYSQLRQGKQPKKGSFTSKRLQRLDVKRNAFMKDTFHKLSKKIVSYCLTNGIDTIVIGKNKGWKTDVTMRKKDKQTFIQIPFNLFVSTLTYKANEQGILVIETEESYTSKASFLDRDDIPTYGKEKEKTPVFSGIRTSRGMYTSFKYGKINADVNGAANILRKVFPQAFGTDRDSGVLKRPQSWSFKHLNKPLGVN